MAQQIIGIGTVANDGTGDSVRVAFGKVNDNFTELYSGKQDADADLTALAGLSGTNTIYYRSAANTWTAVTIGGGLTFATGTLSASGGGSGDLISTNNLSDLTNFATARSNLGLGSIATQASSGVTITGGTITGITDIAVADGGTGASTASAARTNLGLVIGTDVQAYDADLATYASITPSANVQNLLGAANYSAMRTLLTLVIGTNVQAWDADLDAVAALTTPATTITGAAQKASNLSDLASASTARTNLGLGPIATAAASDYRLSPPIPSGQYVTPGGFGGYLAAGTAPGANVLKMFMGYIRKSITITGLGVRVSTLSAGGNFQVAIYAMDATTGWPTGAPLVTSANLSTAAAAGVADTTVSYAITAGWYWFASNCDNGTAAAHTVALIGSNSELSGAANITNATSANGLTKSSITFGSWPTLTGSKSTDSLSDNSGTTMPVVLFAH